MKHDGLRSTCTSSIHTLPLPNRYQHSTAILAGTYPIEQCRNALLRIYMSSIALPSRINELDLFTLMSHICASRKDRIHKLKIVADLVQYVDAVILQSVSP